MIQTPEAAAPRYTARMFVYGEGELRDFFSGIDKSDFEPRATWKNASNGNEMKWRCNYKGNS